MFTGAFIDILVQVSDLLNPQQAHGGSLSIRNNIDDAGRGVYVEGAKVMRSVLSAFSPRHAGSIASSEGHKKGG